MVLDLICACGFIFTIAIFKVLIVISINLWR